jgi:TolA-binding protein
VRRTPELAMQEGNAALARRDYPAAEQAAREVLTGNRTSPRAYDAQFLLAQALMGERQYSQAAIAYDDTYNRSRKGQHAPDALIGLANSLIAINEKKAACDTLSKLRIEFPAPHPDIHDAATASAQRAGCR